MLQIIITLANVKIKAPQIFFSENVGEEYFLVYFCQATQNWFWRKKLQDFKYKLKKKKTSSYLKKKKAFNSTIHHSYYNQGQKQELQFHMKIINKASG